MVQLHHTLTKCIFGVTQLGGFNFTASRVES